MQNENLKKTIFLSLVALALIASVLILTFAIFLYAHNLANSADNQLELAIKNAHIKIEEIKFTSQVASMGLIDSKYVEGLILDPEEMHARATERWSGVSSNASAYVNIYDHEGSVLFQTLTNGNMGQNKAHLPHIAAALGGRRVTSVVESETVQLSVNTSMPVVALDGNLLGVVSFGYRLDTQDIVSQIKQSTGCDVSVFAGSKRVASTLTDGNDASMVGTFLAEDVIEEISKTIVEGNVHVMHGDFFGQKYLLHYAPLYGMDGEVIGMISVGLSLKENTELIRAFIINGILITMGVFLLSIAIAVYLAAKVDGRIKVYMDATNKAMQEKDALSGLEIILNALNAMVYVTNPKTYEIIFINDTMKEHFEIEGDPTGQICYKLFQTDMDTPCTFCPCHQLNNQPDKPIVWEEKNTKTGRNYLNTDNYIKLPNGKTVHMQHSVDTTELIEAREVAEQSNRTKSIFLANMSHEVRTPMNAILGISEIQLRNKTNSEEVIEAFEKICDSGTLLLNIINDILDFSRIEAGKLEISGDIYDIPSLIHDTIQINRMRFESKALKFSLKVDENTPVELFGDELRLRQILNNLLSNAFKYTEEGEVVMSVSSEVNDDAEKDTTLVFVVSDTGQGMTEKQLEQLFEQYSRFNLVVNRSIDGTGLGMSITKGLVDLMGGKIFVQSEYGKGSVFTVKIPQKKSGDALCGPELAERLQKFRFRGMSISRRARTIYEYMPYGSVLVVDDIESNMYVAKGMLAPYGLALDTARSGKEAVERVTAKIAEGKAYDIIFMDHMMPEMNGVEAVAIIRDMGYEGSIVALTANAVSGQAEMFLANGFDGFVSKPIDSRELNQYLIEMIRDKYPAEVVEAAKNEQASYAEVKVTQQEVERFFITDATRTMQVIEQTLQQLQAGDVPQETEMFTIAAHGLKSALANIGEVHLADIAYELEQAGEVRNFAAIAEVAPKLLESLQSLVSALTVDEVADEQEIEMSADDKAFLKESLLELSELCLKFDKPAIRVVLNRLHQRTFPSYVNKIIDEMSANILHSAFGKAAQLARNTAEDLV